MKKILYFSNHLRGPKGAAGARSWHQVRRLGDDYEVCVIIPAIDPVTAQTVTEQTFAGLNPNTVTVKRVHVGSNDRSSLWRRTRYYLAAMPRQFWYGITAKRPDVVLSMGLPITTLFLAWLASVWHRSKLVVDVRDLPFDTAAELGYIRNKIVIATLRGIEGFLLRRADAVITNSPRYVPALGAKGIAANKITLAYIGYDAFEAPSLDIISDWRAEMLAKLDPATEVIAIYSGTLGFVVPIEEILAGAMALKEERRFGFVFLGDGQRLEKFREVAETNGLNAYFAGRVTKMEVMAACRAADLCLYPSSPGRFSGAILGNKVFDYLGADKPVLYVGKDSAVWDLLQELKAGVFTPLGAPEEFAQNVRQLSDNDYLARSLSGNAAKLETRGLTAVASANQVATVINQVLASTA